MSPPICKDTLDNSRNVIHLIAKSAPIGRRTVSNHGALFLFLSQRTEVNAMFIWDFLLGTVMDQFIDWTYGQVIGFLGDFFAQMGNMGVDLIPKN